MDEDPAVGGSDGVTGDDVEAVIFDVDGTLLRGEEPIPGASEALETVREAGLSVLCVSNNPVDPPAAYARRLAAAGLPVEAEEVVTSGVVTADYLAREAPDAGAFVVGEAGLVELLADRGVAVVEDPRTAGTVVASIDREFDYDRLTAALQAFEAGDPLFVGTDPDRTIPAGDGLRPGSGAVLDAVASVAERPPDRVLGKPDRATREAALARLGVPADRCLVVGDRLDTDVALGAGAGMETALVLSGVTDRSDLGEDGPAPDHVLGSVAELPGILPR